NSSATDTVVRRVDLTASASVPPPVHALENTSFGASVFNNGFLPATGVTLSLALPSYVTLISVTPDDPQSVSCDVVTATCWLPPLNHGEGKGVTFVVRAN